MQDDVFEIKMTALASKILFISYVKKMTKVINNEINR